jgi:hypothetical protein
MLLEDDEWRAWSDSEIGRRCAVAQSFVWKIRQSLISKISEPGEPRTYIAKSGKRTIMRTGRIGKRRSRLPAGFLRPGHAMTAAGPTRPPAGSVRPSCGQKSAPYIERA